MALTDAVLVTVGNTVDTELAYASLHSADPSTTGANETTAARVAVTWSVDADGDLTATNLEFTGGAASGAVTHVGFWSASTAGTFKGAFALTGDAAFNASGAYTVTSVSIPVSST